MGTARAESWVITAQGTAKRLGRTAWTGSGPVGSNSFGPARNLLTAHPYGWQSPWVLPQPADPAAVQWESATSPATLSIRSASPLPPYVNLGTSSIPLTWGNNTKPLIPIVDLRATTGSRDGSVRVDIATVVVADDPPPVEGNYYDNWAVVVEVDANGKPIRAHDLFNAKVVLTGATYNGRVISGAHITTDNHQVDDWFGDGLGQGARAGLSSGRAGLFTQDDTDRYLAYAAGTLPLAEVATHSVAIALRGNALGLDEAELAAMKAAGLWNTSEVWGSGVVTNQEYAPGWNNGQDMSGWSQRLAVAAQYPMRNADSNFDDTAGQGYTGDAKVGTTVGIPRTVDLTDPQWGLDAAGRAAASFFQNYVGIVVDRSSQHTWFFDAKSSTQFRNALVAGSPTQCAKVVSMLRVMPSYQWAPNGAGIEVLRCRPLAGPIS